MFEAFFSLAAAAAAAAAACCCELADISFDKFATIAAAEDDVIDCESFWLNVFEVTSKFVVGMLLLLIVSEIPESVQCVQQQKN